MLNGRVYEIRVGDGNDGTRVYDFVAIPSWITEVVDNEMNYNYDALTAVVHAITINRYISKHQTRRFVMDNMPIEDGVNEHDRTLFWSEGPNKATAFGSSWLIVEARYVGTTDEVKAYNYRGPAKAENYSSVYDLLDLGSKRWLRNRGIRL